MHHIYHTEGIILGSKNFGEAGKYYKIFTRDLGMVSASASGVRKMSSKLRYILQDFAYIKVDLVRGKDFWRVTSASKTSMLEGFAYNLPALSIYSNISHLLRRLLAGEDANPVLFSDVINGLSKLESAKDKEALLNIETVMVLRILHNLGYIGENNAVKPFTASPFEGDIVFAAAKDRAKILKEINKALKETHL